METGNCKVSFSFCIMWCITSRNVLWAIISLYFAVGNLWKNKICQLLIYMVEFKEGK